MAAAGGSWNKGRYTSASGQISLRAGDIVRARHPHAPTDRYRITGRTEWGTYTARNLDARPGSFADAEYGIAPGMTPELQLVETAG